MSKLAGLVHTLLCPLGSQTVLGRTCQAISSDVLPLMPPALEFPQGARAHVLTGPSFPHGIALQNGIVNVTFPMRKARLLIYFPRGAPERRLCFSAGPEAEGEGDSGSGKTVFNQLNKRVCTGVAVCREGPGRRCDPLSQTPSIAGVNLLPRETQTLR